MVQDLVIVGGGPAGLAAAIAASRVGLDYVVIERGSLVNTVQGYPTNMVFFTTPELLEIGGIPFTTPYEKPTRVEALRYYRKVTELFELRVNLREEVVRISENPREVPARFEIETRSVLGERRILRAHHVVIATGAFDRPNRLDVPGEDLPHVSHYYRESHQYFRQRVVIVGGKNSAAEAALELYRNGSHVTLVHRGAALGDSIKYWVRPDIENRIREGSVTAHFNTRVIEIRPTTVIVEEGKTRNELHADSVLLLTGYHADVSLFEHAGVDYDRTTYAPRFDPATHETNVPGLFVIGSAVTGRQSGQIFIENGRFHGELVVDVIRQRTAELTRSRE